MSPYRPTSSGCASGKTDVRSVLQHLSHFIQFLMPRFLEFFSFRSPPRLHRLISEWYSSSGFRLLPSLVGAYSSPRIWQICSTLLRDQKKAGLLAMDQSTGRDWPYLFRKAIKILAAESDAMRIDFSLSGNLGHTERIVWMIGRWLSVEHRRVRKDRENANSHRHQFWAKRCQLGTLHATIRERHQLIECVTDTLRVFHMPPHFSGRMMPSATNQSYHGLPSGRPRQIQWA